MHLTITIVLAIALAGAVTLVLLQRKDIRSLETDLVVAEQDIEIFTSKLIADTVEIAELIAERAKFRDMAVERFARLVKVGEQLDQMGVLMGKLIDQLSDDSIEWALFDLVERNPEGQPKQERKLKVVD